MIPRQRAAGWQVLGIPVRIDPSWGIIGILVACGLAMNYFPDKAPGYAGRMYWLLGIAGSGLLLACVLLHELGHALVARAHGIKVSGIVLFMFGGVSQIAHDPKRPAAELSIALAGPCVSLLISALAFWLEPHAPPRAPAALVHYLASVNLGLMLFNLLPGFPLDGGRVLRALIWQGTGNARAATRIASRLGELLGFGLMALGGWTALTAGWGGGLWYFLLGWFLRDAAVVSGRVVEPGRP